jgi:hypothetical protein
VDYGFVTHLSGDVVWRAPVALQIPFALLTLFTIPFLPESPRWLYAHNRHEEGDQVLARLNSSDVHDEHVQILKADILEAIRLEATNEIKFRSMWHDDEMKTKRRLLICFLIQSLQQLGGNNLVVYFASVLFQHMGFDAYQTALLSTPHSFMINGRWLCQFVLLSW